MTETMPSSALRRGRSWRASASERLVRVADARLAWARRYRRPPPAPEAYVAGVTRLGWGRLGPALLGFVGLAAILWGASQPTSPFTVNQTTLTIAVKWPAWYFGVGPPGNQSPFLGIVAVYGGMVLLAWGWLGLVRLVRRHPGVPVRALAPVFVAWMLPMLVVAPIFSRDVYSYVAQGEQMSHGISPYVYGPQVLGLGGNPYAALFDFHLWGDVTSPYGPVFLWVGGEILRIVGHDELSAIVGFRLLAVIGTVLIAVFSPQLARSYGRDPALAFVLVALNPLVLLHLVGGAHNDALMMGLLVAGLALARRGRPVVGVVLCALATLVKVPAVLGILYIGWDWLGTGIPWRHRVRPVVTAGLIGLAVMGALSEAIGLGWGWAFGLTNPDTVRSWMDPATAVGLLAAKVVGAVSLGDHTHVLLTVARGSAFLVAVVIGIRLLLRSDTIGSLRALGLTMLAVVLLGPVVQPWYLAWGLVLLSPVAGARMRVVIISLSIVVSFLGLPGGATMLRQLTSASPLALTLASAALVVIAAVPTVPRLFSARRTEVTEAPADEFSLPRS